MESIYIHYLTQARKKGILQAYNFKGRRFSDKYFAMIDDGTDQKTTNIPRVHRETKVTGNLTYV